MINGNWTPEQRDELLRSVKEGAADQIEGDAELRAMVDWMITSLGMTPSADLYRLVFLTSVMVTIA